MQVHRAALEAFVDNVAAVLGDGRANACIEQFLDLLDDLGVDTVIVDLFSVVIGGRAAHGRLARRKMIHHSTQDHGL